MYDDISNRNIFSVVQEFIRLSKFRNNMLTSFPEFITFTSGICQSFFFQPRSKMLTKTEPKCDVIYICTKWHLRGLSVKFEDTVNTEAKTSNHMESFLFMFLRTI